MEVSAPKPGASSPVSDCGIMVRGMSQRNRAGDRTSHSGGRGHFTRPASRTMRAKEEDEPAQEPQEPEVGEDGRGEGRRRHRLDIPGRARLLPRRDRLLPAAGRAGPLEQSGDAKASRLDLLLVDVHLQHPRQVPGDLPSPPSGHPGASPPCGSRRTGPPRAATAVRQPVLGPGRRPRAGAFRRPCRGPGRRPRFSAGPRPPRPGRPGPSTRGGSVRRPDPSPRCRPRRPGDARPRPGRRPWRPSRCRLLRPLTPLSRRPRPWPRR